MPPLQTSRCKTVDVTYAPLIPSQGAALRVISVIGGGHTIPSVKYPITRMAERLLGTQCHTFETVPLAWQWMQQQP
ncbi:MAG: hypothetical protein ACKO37_01975 [Vampirovibrionales bacterium]